MTDRPPITFNVQWGSPIYWKFVAVSRSWPSRTPKARHRRIAPMLRAPVRCCAAAREPDREADSCQRSGRVTQADPATKLSRRSLRLFRLTAATPLRRCLGRDANLNAKFSVDERMTLNGRFKKPLGPGPHQVVTLTLPDHVQIRQILRPLFRRPVVLLIRQAVERRVLALLGKHNCHHLMRRHKTLHSPAHH